MRTVSLAEDELAHERIPATGLVTEMRAGLEERADRNFLFFEGRAELALHRTGTGT